jgi:hypothetical protein
VFPVKMVSLVSVSHRSAQDLKFLERAPRVRISDIPGGE